jgi:hypothetical protein
MLQTKIEKTGEYLGKSATGISYRVIEFTEFINATTVSDTEIKWSPGLLVYRLPDGDPVNHIEGDTYQIVRTGEKITFVRSR